ncbi:MAG: energy transducer TonB [Sphingomonas bacterium]|uniref:energy transducer TonB n=1 Tax=Sphingomonas bacterium TaxID=1895847 RepID=UPI00262D7D77|nr:energy transducer TonB [Sphingomonas bacterium]MDB5707675.1 energy transducer TonB [Sphingomonas bacterium]
MAYADRNVSGNRVVAIVIVSIIVAVMGYAFVTGLTYKYIKAVNEKLKTFDVEEPPPPPPDEPPPPPPDQPLEPPPVVSPPPIVTTQAPPQIVMQTVQTPPPPAPLPPPAPPAPPAPPRISQAAGLKGNPAQFFGNDAYPSEAIRAGAQGRVVARLTVGTDGRVSGCVVTTSSGNSSLDDTTCRIARSRVRYTPAKDENGQPIVSSATLPVRWVLPTD